MVRAQWKGHISTTKTGVTRTVSLVAELAAALRARTRGSWLASMRA